MKKKLKYTLSTFLLMNLFIYSQTKEFCGEIKYKFITNLAYEYVENYKLIFNNYESYCLEENIKKEVSKKTNEDKEEGLQQNFIVGRKNTIPKYFYNTLNNFYVKDNYLNTILVYREKPLKEKWQLENKTKKLSNFNCKKATINFRGRNYTAWYTTEIPVPFGPWKLRGLPGLILELYDDDKVFHIIANNVKLSKNNCNVNFDKKETEKALALDNYLEEKEKLIDKMFSKMSAKRPKGTKPFKRDKNCKDCSKGIEIFNEKN